MKTFFLLFSLTRKSIFNRKFTAALTIASISISVLLLLAVEKVRTETKSSFSNTVSGADLIVGARSGSVQLLLYSVFRIGNATNNIDWKSFQEISQHPSVAWAIPISLGDSHRGYRVMGTTGDYFSHYHFGHDQSLQFSDGKPFVQVYDAVLGADVAETLHYRLGEKIVLAHGVGDAKFSRHEDKPFTVVGILKRTGTPVDRTVHVGLSGIEAMHVDWKSGARSHNTVSAEEALSKDLTPKQITAFLLGLKSKMAIFKMQRAINEYKAEPLLAILPGVALQELWDLIGVGEKALLAVSFLVVFNSFVGLLTVILTNLNERRREVAILRSLGARPWQVFLLLTLESFMFTIVSCVMGILIFYLVILITQPVLQQQFGLFIPMSGLSVYDLKLLLAVIISSVLLGFIPGYRAYRYSLVDGMSIKL